MRYSYKVGKAGDSRRIQVRLYKKFFGLFLLSILTASTAWSVSPALKVSGNQIVTASTACTIILRGVNVDSLEFMATGQGPTSGGITATVGESIQQWGCNVIRLPLSQDFWFGVPNSKSTSVSKNNYRALVDNIVKICSDNNAYALLDLHWSGTATAPSAPGGSGWGTAIAQQDMPDANALTFWSDLAARYANNPAVLFDLYNEPHGVSWDIWKNGGDSGNGFNTPGLQALLNAIRATGAHNMVVAGGLDWAYDLRGIVSGGVTTADALTDSIGSGVAYASHIYPWKGSAPWVPANGDSEITVAANLVPILIGEFGQNQTDVTSCANCSDAGYAGYSTGAWGASVLAWINQHHYHYTAWDMNTSSSPILIANWQFTPTTYLGVQVKADLATLPTVEAGLGCVAGFVPTETPTPTSTNTSTPTVTGTIPTDTPTVTNTLTNTATITMTPISTTCTSVLNGCETINENGNWWGNNSNITIVDATGAPTGAITQGSHCLKVNIAIGTGWNNSVCNLGGFTPSVWADVAQLKMDVYAEPALIAASGSWYQLFLRADIGSALGVTISSPVSFNLASGANALTFNINLNLSGQTPTSNIAVLYLIYNSQYAATGNFYVDNLRLVRGCQFTPTQTPPVTATFTETPTATYSPTESETPTITSTPTETPTGTWNTATFTSTFTPTVTSTLTPTVTQTTTSSFTPTPLVEGPVAVFYPNPVTLGTSVNLSMPENANTIKVRLFTSAYRKVLETSGLSQPDRIGRYYYPIELKDDKGSPLGNGLYYAVVESENFKKTLKLLVAR
jgi:hypothetical protein